MEIVCDVHHAECLRYGVEAPSSTVKIEVNPKLLTPEQRSFILENLEDGRFPRNQEFNICPPTYAGLIASVTYGIARKQEYERRASGTSTAKLINERAALRERLVRAAICG